MVAVDQDGNEFHLIDRAEWREVKQLIERLDPPARVAWLVWCCDRVNCLGNPVRVTESTGEAWQVFGDWMTLAYLHGLDWKASRDELLKRVRQFGSALSWGTELCRLLP